MQSLRDCLAKFNSPQSYIAPVDFFALPTKQDRESKVLVNLIISISHYALCLLANAHNKVMASNDLLSIGKFLIVIVLDIAALGVFAFAKAEAAVRLAVGISLLIPGLIVALCCDNSLLLVPLVTAIITFVQVINAPITIYFMTTQRSNVRPEIWSDALIECCTLGLTENLSEDL